MLYMYYKIYMYYKTYITKVHVRNGYCKRVITSTAESKRVFFLNHKLHSENEDKRPM